MKVFGFFEYLNLSIASTDDSGWLYYLIVNKYFAAYLVLAIVGLEYSMYK